MANSIFKEVTFTPHSFDKDIALENQIKFEKLLNSLDDITDSGIIIGISRQWKNRIIEHINKYDENNQSELKEILKRLQDRQRLVSYPISKEFGEDESNWIEQANTLNEKRLFDVIIASKDGKTSKQIDHIDRRFFKNKGAITHKQTKRFMTDMLLPILSYADIVTVMDPYFSLNRTDYIETMEVVCKNLANHHGIKDEAIIDIHTSIKGMIVNKEFKWEESDKWPEIIKKYEYDYGHTISLNIREDLEDNKWHDRWIITNQCGISMGKGADRSDSTDSTWSLLDWKELSIISNKFDQNREVYNYIGAVTSAGIVRNQNPKNTSTYRTKKEKEKEKKKYLKDLEIKKEDKLKRKKERLYCETCRKETYHLKNKCVKCEKEE